MVKAMIPWKHLCFAGVGALILLGAVWYLVPVSKITPENCQRIKEGMTKLEVEEILGGRAKFDGPCKYPHTWIDGQARILVFFDNDCRVQDAKFECDNINPVVWFFQRLP